MRDILLRRVGKIIDSVYDGKCGSNRNAHGVDDRLDPEFPELYSCLLQC